MKRVDYFVPALGKERRDALRQLAKKTSTDCIELVAAKGGLN